MIFARWLALFRCFDSVTIIELLRSWKTVKAQTASQSIPTSTEAYANLECSEAERGDKQERGMDQWTTRTKLVVPLIYGQNLDQCLSILQEVNTSILFIQFCWPQVFFNPHTSARFFWIRSILPVQHFRSNTFACCKILRKYFIERDQMMLDWEPVQWKFNLSRVFLGQRFDLLGVWSAIEICYIWLQEKQITVLKVLLVMEYNKLISSFVCCVQIDLIGL